MISTQFNSMDYYYFGNGLFLASSRVRFYDDSYWILPSLNSPLHHSFTTLFVEYLGVSCCSDKDVGLCIYDVYNQFINPSRLEHNDQSHTVEPTVVNAFHHSFHHSSPFINIPSTRPFGYFPPAPPFSHASWLNSSITLGISPVVPPATTRLFHRFFNLYFHPNLHKDIQYILNQRMV